MRRVAPFSAWFRMALHDPMALAKVTWLLLSATLPVVVAAQSDTAREQESPNPPVVGEIQAGSHYFSTQLLIRKRFTPRSRLTFINITITNGSYRNERAQNEYISQSYVGVELLKGLLVTPGVVINQQTGFRPTVGLNYVLTRRYWSAVLLPRIDLRDSYNTEVFSLVEAKPPLRSVWMLYTRLQGLYNRASRPASHSRSYVLGRLGISRPPYTGGVGINYDNYGPERRQQLSYGFFLRIELIN